MPGLWLACAVTLLGHNPDTSYARVQISADKIQTRLTLDVFTLLMITPLDDNNDSHLSRAELTAHTPTIQRFLRDRIGLAVSAEDEDADLGELTGFVWPPDIGDAIAAADFHTANGLIHFDFSRQTIRTPEEVAIAFGTFDQFGDRHTVLGVFVFQGQDYELTFSKFEPDFTYVTGVVHESTSAESRAPPAPTGSTPLSERLWRFFKLGVEHIFLGYDHICFLIALIVVSNFRETVKIITSFTIAHSITLILATLDVIRLPPQLVETVIAATIVYVSVENIWIVSTTAWPPATQLHARNPSGHRWWLTFFFGLIHGFGFAGVLRELGLPTTGLVRCLLAFNIGVEVGQLAIALALLPVALALNRWKHGRYVVIAISLLLALFGLAWFVDRAFTFDFMPF